jgi:Nucleotidyl transferase AbiEii toxin, Type IV TA system
VSRISRGTPASDAYIDLQGQARRTGRPTQDLLQLYVLEGFLDRLAVSDLRDSFVLKGGVLLAAFDTRRPTKDVDLAGLNLANDTNTVLEFVRTVLIVAPSQDDGVEFFPDTATAMLIREGDAYSGVRVHVNAGLVTARLPFHVDVNIGDPIWPEPAAIAVPRLRGGAAIELSGYPLQMVHAEKIVTAVQRGIANTRWRDFGDIWTLSRRQPIDAADLKQAIDEVARYRGARLAPLAEVLEGYAEFAEGGWSGWHRRSNADHLPEQFAEVLAAVIEFADPILSGSEDGTVWTPGVGAWR